MVNDTFPSTFPEEWKSESFIRGQHFYVRDVRLDLAAVIAGLTTDSKANKVRYLHIYCDDLFWGGPLNDGVAVVDLSALKERLRYIHIYAVRFLTTVQGLKTLKVTGAAQVQIQIVSESVPEKLLILGANCDQNKLVDGCELFSGPIVCDSYLSKQCTHEHFRFDLTDVGFSFMSGDSKIYKPLTFVPVQEVMGPSVDDIELLGPDTLRMDNLTKLLHWLFITASTDVMCANPHVGLVATRLRYIIRCTKAALNKIDMAADAETLLNTFDFFYENKQKMPAQSRRFFIETLSLTENLESLKVKLQAADVIDHDLKKDQTQSKTIELLKADFGRIISIMGDNMKSFVDLDSLERRATYDILDWAAKVRDLEAAQSDSTTASEKMKQGIVAHQEIKNKEARRKAVIAGIELIIGIAYVNVLISLIERADLNPTSTRGDQASSTLTVARADKIKHDESAEASSFEKLWDATKKLVEVGVKIVPTLTAVYETQTCFNKFGETEAEKKQNKNASLGNQVKKVAAGITTPSFQTDLNTVDFTGILAAWDSFQIDTDEYFEVLKAQFNISEVDGMADYRKALNKQIIQGKTMLQAMKNAQESSQAYYRGTAEAQARLKRANELKEAAAQLAKQDDADRFKEKLIYNYNRRLASLRRALYIEFRRCILAYLYEFNERAIPSDFLADTLGTLSLRADREIRDYEEIRLKLSDMTEKKTRAQANMQPSAATITYGTVAGEGILVAFRPEWKENMLQTKRIPFEIPMEYPRGLKGRQRVRVTKVSAEFEGLTVKVNSHNNPTPYIQYRIGLGPEMADVNIGGETPTFVYFYYPGRSVEQVAGLRDVTWSDNGQKFLQPTLYTCGEIVFDRDYSPVDQLSTITGIKLYFETQHY